METNSTSAALPITLTAPNFGPVSLTWIGHPAMGQAAIVVHTVAGFGSPSGSDATYCSTNAVLDGPDTQSRSQKPSLALAVGSSHQVTNTVTIPANAPPGYYLILETDDQNTVFEANETNNWPACAASVAAGRRVFGVGQYRDSDGDGIPDWWEQQCLGSITNCAPDADPDGDGLPNLLEYLADTNPTKASPKSEGREWNGKAASRPGNSLSATAAFRWPPTAGLSSTPTTRPPRSRPTSSTSSAPTARCSIASGR